MYDNMCKICLCFIKKNGTQIIFATEKTHTRWQDEMMFLICVRLVICFLTCVLIFICVNDATVDSMI